MDLKEAPPFDLDQGLKEKFEKTSTVCKEIQKALEKAKQKKIIPNTKAAQLRITAEGEWLKFLQNPKLDWPSYLSVSQVVVVYEIDSPFWSSEKIRDLSVLVKIAEGTPCKRCGNYSTTVGKEPKHKDLCSRCCEAVAQM